MKIRLFAIALVAVIVGLNACGGKKDDDPKSKECLITSFTDGSTSWVIDNTAETVKGSYKKETPLNNIAPTIVCSSGAKVSPASGTPGDFSDNKTVTYTVTAEDGKTKKIYTASATAMLP